MTQTASNSHSRLFSLTLAGVTLALILGLLSLDIALIRSVEADLVAPAHEISGEQANLREAKALQRKLLDEGSLPPPLAMLQNAIRKRQAMMSQPVIVTFDNGGLAASTWIVHLSHHPTWVTFSYSLLSAEYHLDESAIAEELRFNQPTSLPLAMDATAVGIVQDKKVMRTTITGHAQQGYVLDPDLAARLLSSAFEHGSESITIPVAAGGGGMILQLPDGTSQRLALLASGKSDFEKSPDARAWNIEKALNEKLYGIVVDAGQLLSFNDTLDVPVTLKKGWKEALGIFGGGTAMTPGGGICQAATTTYRAAMLAGFPIVKRKAHSLYVSYYEKGGVGLDATVFPGIQELVFKNDTQHPIIIEGKTHGTEAIVNIYGIPDGRHVVLEGPYLSSTKNRPAGMRGLAANQIGWVQRVTRPGQEEREHNFVATYQKGIPHKLRGQYVTAIQMENVHAAAPAEGTVTLGHAAAQLAN